MTEGAAAILSGVARLEGGAQGSSLASDPVRCRSATLPIVCIDDAHRSADVKDRCRLTHRSRCRGSTSASSVMHRWSSIDMRSGLENAI